MERGVTWLTKRECERSSEKTVRDRRKGGKSRNICGSLRSRGCWQWKVVVVYVHGDEVGGVRLGGAHITAMRGGNKNHATRMLSLANEEPLVVVKAGVDIVWKVI